MPGGEQAATLRWPGSDTQRRPPESSPLYAYLLDVDEELAERFDARMRLAARSLTTARVLDAPAGQCALEPWLDAADRGLGLLILSGLLTHETRVADRTATQILGAGDLLQPPCPAPDDMLDRTDTFCVLRPTRFALLDPEFAARTRPWPQITMELLKRCGRRLADVDSLRAITCQPRLEMRLVLLLWHLAARWGRVEPGGIHLTLPLTHRVLGQLVGAERPSISHALARLARASLVTGTACDLHLHGTVQRHIDALQERPPSRAQHEAGGSAGRRAGAAAGRADRVHGR